jgi:thioesterase domain-containing protein
VPSNENADADATDVDPADLVSLVNAMFESRIPVIHRLGIRIVEVRDGLIVGAAPLAGNLNYQGSMYAGTLFGLGEALGGGVFFANFDLRRFTATVKDMKIRYRRPAMTDVRAEASLDASTIARIKREADDSGKTEFVLDAELTDTEGVVVAITHGTYQVRTYETASTPEQ